ncbi:MAG: hypothetical protein HYZ22_05170 [Chloroflexi bacterium]|nr:hypothetical protein [Chloroflexota bacterium]
MTEVIKYFLFPIFISMLLIIPAILFDIWLCKIGISRDSKAAIILTTFSLAYLKQIFLPDLSWRVTVIIILFASTIVTHRIDFGEALKHGKWWWLQKN